MFKLLNSLKRSSQFETPFILYTSSRKFAIRTANHLNSDPSSSLYIPLSPNGVSSKNRFPFRDVRSQRSPYGQHENENYLLPTYLTPNIINPSNIIPISLPIPNNILSQDVNLEDKKKKTKRPNTRLRIASKFISNYLALSKHKLSFWVALNSLPGLFLANTISPSTLLCVTMGTYISSACAASLNNTIERYRDAQMYRTRLRPVASGRVNPQTAYTFSLLTGISGLSILGLGCSSTPAIISAITIGLYAFAYTPLKVISPYNTHLGSICGSLPILIGCSAAGISLLTPEPWVLFTIQTLWQFPHFYALAWLHKDDYERAGYRMFPLSDKTGIETANRCQRYLAATTFLPFITSYYGVTSWMFTVDSLIPNLATIFYLREFKLNPTKKNLRKFFFVQLWQLLALLILAVYHCRSMLQSKNFISIYDTVETDQNDAMTSNLFDQFRPFLIKSCNYLFLEDFFFKNSAETKYSQPPHHPD